MPKEPRVDSVAILLVDLNREIVLMARLLSDGSDTVEGGNQGGNEREL